MSRGAPVVENFPMTIHMILSSLSLVVLNPAFGPAGLAGKFAPILTLLTDLIGRGEEAWEEAKVLDAQLRTIVTEGRTPTDAEWAEWEARHEAAKARLQS